MSPMRREKYVAWREKKIVPVLSLLLATTVIAGSAIYAIAQEETQPKSNISQAAESENKETGSGLHSSSDHLSVADISQSAGEAEQNTSPLTETKGEETTPADALLESSLPGTGLDPVQLLWEADMTEEMQILEEELRARIDLIRSSIGIPQEVQIAYGEENWADIWAVYAWKREMTEDYPHGVLLPDEEAKRDLRSIYWTLTQVCGALKIIGGEPVYEIHVERKNFPALTEKYYSEEEESERIEQEAILSDLTSMWSGLLPAE